MKNRLLSGRQRRFLNKVIQENQTIWRRLFFVINSYRGRKIQLTVCLNHNSTDPERLF